MKLLNKTFIAVIIICSIWFSNCTKRSKFNSRDWKNDKLELVKRPYLIGDLEKNKTFFNWSESEIEEHLGSPSRIYNLDSINTYVFMVSEKFKDSECINYQYVGFDYNKDQLVRYERVEWDTIKQFKRIVLFENSEIIKG